MTPPRERESDRRDVEQATRSDGGGDDQEDGATALASVAAGEEREQRRGLERRTQAA